MPTPDVTFTVDSIWAGTEKSLDEFLSAQGRLQARIAAGPYDQEEEDQLPRCLSIEDGIATVRIHGSLTNRDSPWNQYIGVTSYNEIREALVAAASDETVARIVLDINSGGGSVNGVADTGNLIRTINDKVKSVTAYTDGTMCSAAYWLGCSAGEVYASNVSTVGSIGVISTHMEYSKQLKEDGVGVTVFRGGKYKALVNSVEPLTEEAKTQFQSQINEAEKVFVQHVATMLNESYDTVYANMAQGREFFGEQALRAGLVDGITTYDKMMSSVKKSIDNQSNLHENSFKLTQGADMKNKKALTEQEIAALAEGTLMTAGVEVGVTDAATTTTADVVNTETDKKTETDTSLAAEKTAEVSQTSDVVSFLQGQVREKDSQILEANIQLSGLKSKLADMEATFSGLLEIAGKSINNMTLNLTGGKVDIKSMTATDVLALHKSTTEQFQSKFKAGGVAAVDAAFAEKGEGVTSTDSMFFARLAAAGSTAKAN